MHMHERPTASIHQRKGSIGLSLLSLPLLLLRPKSLLPIDVLAFVSVLARPGAAGRESTRIRLASREAAAELVAPYRPTRLGLVCWEEMVKSSSSQLTARRRPIDSGDPFGSRSRSRGSRSRSRSRSRSGERFGRTKCSSWGEELIRSTR